MFCRIDELSPEHVQRPYLSRRATVQEQISSSFMDSPPPPHLDAPFFGADLIPSGRLRRMRGYRHSPGGLEEEVRHTTRLNALLLRLSRLLVHLNHIHSVPFRHSERLVRGGRVVQRVII